MTDQRIIVDLDGKQAFGPFDEAGVLRFARETLAEGLEDIERAELGDEAVDSSPTMRPVSEWNDDEVMEEFLEIGFQVCPLVPSKSPEQRIVEETIGLTDDELELIYGEAIAGAIVEMREAGA